MRGGQPQRRRLRKVGSQPQGAVGLRARGKVNQDIIGSDVRVGRDRRAAAITDMVAAQAATNAYRREKGLRGREEVRVHCRRRSACTQQGPPSCSGGGGSTFKVRRGWACVGSSTQRLLGGVAAQRASRSCRCSGPGGGSAGQSSSTDWPATGPPGAPVSQAHLSRRGWDSHPPGQFSRRPPSRGVRHPPDRRTVNPARCAVGERFPPCGPLLFTYDEGHTCGSPNTRGLGEGRHGARTGRRWDG